MSLTDEFSLAPFDLVLFGGTGDLAMRKLLPAMYFRHYEKQLPDDGRIICIARSDMSTDEFKGEMEQSVRPHVESMYDDAAWASFCERIHYLSIDITDQSKYQQLIEMLAPHPDRIRVFYLSTAPGLFTRICNGVAEAGLVTDNSRVALEKPLGRDLDSAVAINDELAEVFDEAQIYRIDHYLGKETVQNLMALRFGNYLFEPIWRREHISDIQITIAEQLGVESRAGYYDHTGAMRDMVQNHLLQLLVILAMEPPVSIHPDAVRDEKIKILRSLKPLQGRDVLEHTVRGQYSGGTVGGKSVLAYRESEGVAPNSFTETFVALKAEIDSWRWQGVPFFLRTGKSMYERRTLCMNGVLKSWLTFATYRIRSSICQEYLTA